MARYMEMTYIDNDGNARLTGVGAEFKTDAETTGAFESVRTKGIDIKDPKARFILDLKEEDGEIIDSLALTVESFESITGEKAMSDRHYVNYDNKMNAVVG